MIIYGLFDPREPTEIRYIGKTRRSLKERAVQHYSSPRAYRLRAWIKDLRKNKLHPGVVEIARVPDELGRAAELYWIGHYVQIIGDRLLNVHHMVTKGNQ